MKRLGRRIVTAIAALAVSGGLMTLNVPTASASEESADSTASTAASDGSRTEEVTPIVYGEGRLDLQGHATVKTRLQTSSGAKILLNVHTKPIPKRQIKRCWKVPVGTVVSNEGYWSGVLSVNRHYRIKKGDNTACTKKGHGKQVYKKSCNNRLWGVPGGPKRPPRSLPRVRGRVVFVNAYKHHIEQSVQETVRGESSAEVTVYTSSGDVACHAKSALSVYGVASAEVSVTVRSRTVTRALTKGARKLVIKASGDESLNGKAKTDVDLKITGKVEAMCDVPSTQPPPPPPVDHAPQISCTWPPHVYVNGMQQIWCNASDPDGDTLSVSIVGDSYAHIASVIKVSPGGDGYNSSLCDSSQTCYRATLWGDKVGTTHPVATVAANGKSVSTPAASITVADPSDGF